MVQKEMGYHIDDLLKSDPKSQVQWLRLIKHRSEIGKTWKVFSFFWDETEIMKNLSRAARTHQALVCKGSALVCNNRLQQDSIIQKFFLLKFLEMVRSIKIPWVHVMSTNFNKYVSDFHQFPIWGRFYVLSVFKGNTVWMFPINVFIKKSQSDVFAPKPCVLVK